MTNENQLKGSKKQAYKHLRFYNSIRNLSTILERTESLLCKISENPVPHTEPVANDDEPSLDVFLSTTGGRIETFTCSMYQLLDAIDEMLFRGEE